MCVCKSRWYMVVAAAVNVLSRLTIRLDVSEWLAQVFTVN